MTRQTIAIDIDDVLADNARGFIDFSNKMWGTNLDPSDYEEHWARMWQVDYDEVRRRADIFHESGVVREYTHADEALPVLHRLSGDYNLRIVTARRLQIRQDTLDWVHTHYPGIFTDEVIHFAGIWDQIDDHSIHKTKLEVIDAIDADFLIDDQLKHCLAMADAGRQALLFGDYAWNRMDDEPIDTIRRVDSWAAVEEYFYGK